MPIITKKLPKDWLIEGNQSDLYDVSIDPTVSYQDKPAVLLSSGSATYINNVMLKQVIDGNAWYGKRVRFSCFVKTQEVESDATLSVSVKAPAGNLLVYDPMIDRSLDGNNDWTKLEIVVDVPADGRWITYGPCLHGKGKMWAAQFKVEEVSKSVPRTDDHGTSSLLQPHPVNLDFSEPGDQTKAAYGCPVAGWSWPGNNPNFKSAILDKAFDGSNVAVIESCKPPSRSELVDIHHENSIDENSIGYLCQTFSAKPFRGSRIKFSSFVKTENVDEETVLVLMINGVHNARLALSRMQSLRGDSEWAEYSQVLNVSEFAYSISIWLQMSGHGKSSFARVSLEKVSSSVPTTDGNHQPRNLDFAL